MKAVFCAALLLLVQHVGSEHSPYMLVTRYADIAKLSLDTLQFKIFIREPGGWIKAVDYHYRMNIVFWSNIATNQIHRASLEDGSDAAVIVDSGMLEPVCLAVDWMNNKLYWSDLEMSTIEVYDILKQERKMMINTLGLPLGIAVDPLSGWIYWTNRRNSMIERAKVNAMNTTREVVTDRLTCPSPVIIDYENRMLYWTDYCSFTIVSMALDGGEEFMVQSADIFFCEAMGLLNNTLYWIQFAPVGIFSTSKTGGEKAVMVYSGTRDNPFQDIKVVHSSRQLMHPDALNCSYFHNCTAPLPAPTSPLSLTPTVTSNHTSATTDLFTSREPPYLSPTVAFISTPVPLSTLVKLTTPSLSISLSSLGSLHIHPTTAIPSTILPLSVTHYLSSTPTIKPTLTASGVLRSTPGLIMARKLSASTLSPQRLSASTTTSLSHQTVTSTPERTSVYTFVLSYSISPSPHFTPLQRAFSTTLATSAGIFTASMSHKVSCGPKVISCLSLSPSTVTHNASSLVLPQDIVISVMDIKIIIMMFGGILAVLILCIVGFMVCGCFIIRKKRRRRYLIVESMEVRRSVQGSRLSNNKRYRYRENRSRCRIGSYTPRILDFSDLPPQSSTPIDAGAMTAFSFDGNSTVDNPLGGKGSRSTMTRMSYFSNATEIVGKGSSRNTL